MSCPACAAPSQGYKASCLQHGAMQVVEVAHGPTVARLLAVGALAAAYQVACLGGITQQDWRAVAQAALQVGAAARRWWVGACEGSACLWGSCLWRLVSVWLRAEPPPNPLCLCLPPGAIPPTNRSWTWE